MRGLMVLAHPDDEVIFGWPIIQQGHDLALLTLAHNRARHGEGPEQALQEVCEQNGIALLDFPRLENNFYRQPPRFADTVLKETIKLFSENIERAIDLVKPDFIFTHNPMGEYGHGDHRFTFNITSIFATRMLLTDICFQNACHLSSQQIPSVYMNNFYNGDVFCACELDLSWYKSMQKVYENHKAWTWGGHEPVCNCNLYLFK